MFRIQRVSNYGTSTPAVARTFYQGCEILGFFAVTEAQREEAKGILIELQRHLVRCVEISDGIEREVAVAREDVKVKGLEFQSFGRVVTLPSAPDLQSRAESFLQSAKLAIGQTALLIKPFYGEKHDHRYHKLAAWSEKKFGADDKFTWAIREWEPWVKSIVDMRNAADHPDDTPGGKLLTQNFNFRGTQDVGELVDPTWGFSGEPQLPIVGDMKEIVEGIIELGEEVLAGLFDKLKLNFPLAVYEIPAEERDPACPIRLRVWFAQGMDNA